MDTFGRGEKDELTRLGWALTETIEMISDGMHVISVVVNDMVVFIVLSVSKLSDCVKLISRP